MLAWLERGIAGDLALVSGCGVHVFMEGALFLDGFESGDTAAWSSTVP